MKYEYLEIPEPYWKMTFMSPPSIRGMEKLDLCVTPRNRSKGRPDIESPAITFCGIVNCPSVAAALHPTLNGVSTSKAGGRFMVVLKRGLTVAAENRELPFSRG